MSAQSELCVFRYSKSDCGSAVQSRKIEQLRKVRPSLVPGHRYAVLAGPLPLTLHRRVAAPRWYDWYDHHVFSKQVANLRCWSCGKKTLFPCQY